MKRVIFFILILLTACEEDETEKIVITDLITVTIDQSYITSTTDDWVVVHDEAGNSLDFKTFEAGDVISFETDSTVLGTKVGITLIKAFGQSVKKYNVKSYLDIVLGGAITVKVPPYVYVPRGNNLGKFDVNLTSDDHMINFALGSKLGGGCNQPGSNATKTVNFSCDIFGNATKYLLQASDYFGNSRYQFIDNVKPNDSYDVHFSEMTNFDKVVKFTYPANPSLLLIVEGRESGQSIYDNGYLCFKYWGQSPTQASAEYINALSSYTTYLLLTYPGFFYFYNSHGIVPTNNIAISTPPSFSLSSKSLQNFSSIAGGEFVYRASEYVNRDQLDPFLVSNWIVYSTSSTHVLKSLPNKIAQGIAGLQLENYTHTYTTFTLQSSPYLEAVFREAGSTYTTSGVIIR